MILGVAGNAGSGKDTVAGFVRTYIANTTLLAQADPMKAFARAVFDFTEEQLWGPSERRNTPDERFASTEGWCEAFRTFNDYKHFWVKEVMKLETSAVASLERWFYNLVRVHGFAISPVPSLPVCRDVTDLRVLTPRYMLQTLGTEWGRAVSKSIWNSHAIRTANQLLQGNCSYARNSGTFDSEENSDLVIITDVRFRNEVLGIKQAGGMVLKVESPRKDNESVEKAGVAGHASETELDTIPGWWFNVVLYNNKSEGLLALENKVAEYCFRLPKGRLVLM